MIKSCFHCGGDEDLVEGLMKFEEDLREGREENIVYISCCISCIRSLGSPSSVKLEGVEAGDIVYLAHPLSTQTHEGILENLARAKRWYKWACEFLLLMFLFSGLVNFYC